MATVVEQLGPRRILIAATASLVAVAGTTVAAVSHPAPILVGLVTVVAALALLVAPTRIVIALLFLVPFHNLIVVYAQGHAHVSTGPLTFWKDVVIIALFVRVVGGRLATERSLDVFAEPGDALLIFYMLAYTGLAFFSPPGPTVYRALGRIIEGPLLFFVVRSLRPTRRQLWLMVTAMLTTASIMGIAAVIEKLGPHAGFQTWYGATKPPLNSSFYSGPNSYRSGSFLGSPLILAFYLAGATPFAVAAFGALRRWRVPAALAVGACGGGLVATLTRSGLIGGTIGVLVVVTLAVRNRRIRAAALGVIVVALASVVSYYLAGGSESLIRTSSNSSHRASISRDLLEIEARPWYGYGLGTTDALQQRFKLPGAPGATESVYLARALEGGIPALLLYMVTLYVTGMRVRATRRKALRSRDTEGAVLAAGALGAMIAIAVAGLFLGIQELVVEVMLWVPAGIALAAVSGPEVPSPARRERRLRVAREASLASRR